MDLSKNNDDACVIAVDIGGGSTKLALVSRRGEVREWRSFATVAENGAAFLEKVLAACRSIQLAAQVPVVGVSAAVAGFVGVDGSLEYNPNLTWLEGTPIAAVVSAELGLRSHVEADSNAACLAEYVFGAGLGWSRFLCLTGGTGLGVGMIVEGRLLRIARGCMGDAGHVVVAADGPACTCGGRGCAEAVLSTAYLGRRYAEISGDSNGDYRMLVEAARRDEPEARKLIEEAGYWLGIAAASLASIFMPDRIAVAGGLSQAGDVLFASAQSSFRGHGGRLPLSLASLVCASTGEHATLLGAAACFFYPEML